MGTCLSDRRVGMAFCAHAESVHIKRLSQRGQIKPCPPYGSLYKKTYLRMGTC